MKKYNEELISILRTGTRDIKEYVLYLTLLHNEVHKVSDQPLPKVISDYLTGIQAELIGMNVLDAQKGLKFPLFSSEGSGNTLQWVESIVKQFRHVTRGLPNKVHSLPSTKKRIAELMKVTDVTKEEVQQAVNMYLERTEPRYVMFSHYFVLKGTGVSKTSLLLDHIDELRSMKVTEDLKRTSITGVLQ